jgi:acyl-CoA oxidase
MNISPEPWESQQHTSGQYYLTEVAHGLDAIHLETTATQLPNGEFDLHTPNPGASK